MVVIPDSISEGRGRWVQICVTASTLMPFSSISDLITVTSSYRERPRITICGLRSVGRQKVKCSILLSFKNLRELV